MMKHDWLIAQFQITRGVLAGAIFGVVVAYVAKQVDEGTLALMSYSLSAFLAFFWWYFFRKTLSLRTSLNSAHAQKGVNGFAL